jgi:hypothetical protein
LIKEAAARIEKTAAARVAAEAERRTVPLVHHLVREHRLVGEGSALRLHRDLTDAVANEEGDVLRVVAIVSKVDLSWSLEEKC